MNFMKSLAMHIYFLIFLREEKRVLLAQSSKKRFILPILRE